MSIKRGPLAADNFTIVSNLWTRDAGLSWKAKGLLAYIAGHAAGYELTVKQIIEDGTDGKDAVLSGITELETAGYLKRTRRTEEDGRFSSYDYELCESPARAQGGFSHPGETRTGPDQHEEGISPGQSQSGFSDADNPPTKKTTSKKTTKKTSSEEAPDPRVGQLVADWIDYCGAQNVKLTPQAKGRYAAKIKELVGAGFEVNLIKRALAQMLKRRKEAYPGLLDSFVIEVQGGMPPVPTSGAPAGAGRQPFKTAAEKRDDARARERAILELIDDIRENLPSYNPLDPEQSRAVRREAERRYEQSLQVDESTAGMGVPYSGNRQTDPVDAEWYENHPSTTPPKELTSHANG